MLRFSTRHQLFLVLVALFVTCLLVADIVAGKYFQVGALEMSVGTVTFPIAFLLTDIVNEYYGRPGARMMTGIGMAMLVVAFSLIYMSRTLPVSDGSPVGQEPFDAVFGISMRLFVASLVAYLISQIVDIHAFHFVKGITESKHLWLRAIGSTAVSQVVDTFVVTFGCLAGLRSTSDILVIFGTSYLYKIIVAVMLTPLVYVAHDLITRRMGIEPAPHDERELAAMPAE
ncbi:queuosine precursor transporter [Sandaracinus amylolyticus]|uniref:Probable queuosine precursor transporter n=1 Tax=Sandaracinus amylolyticus TaxID=927083 RepID=A0A0F6W3L3_9BACT|nr:queuosine precursor transporter [Sandaracinus amylolyticus]AKF06536.1 Putative preQ0 transporter [Sandaracinus amylolyticus]